MHSLKRRLLAISLTQMLLLLAVAPALVSGAFHGVAVGKATNSPLHVGDPYTSTSVISNTLDTGHDTLRITGLSDVVNASGGAVSSGPILATTGLVFNNPALVSCTGGSGAGTSLNPYIGATSCMLLFGGSITTKPFSHYTVQPNDFNLPLHRLSDTVTWNWNNTCTFDPDNDCSTAPQLGTAGASALILPSNGGPCPAAPGAFQLGAAGTYTVLVLEGGKLVISQGETKVTGDVGMSATSKGDLLKATIDGDLFLDPTASPDIHTKDLKVTGSIITKDMSAEHDDALAANLTLAAMPPTQAPIGTITNSTTITGGPGMNVISLGGVNMVKKTLTIAGGPSSMFVFNVTGGFNFSQSQMVLTGGVQPNNIMWNFIGTGADINIFKTGTQAYGTYLAPYRNFIQDHAVLNGRYIGATTGFSLKIHSAATVTCP